MTKGTGCLGRFKEGFSTAIFAGIPAHIGNLIINAGNPEAILHVFIATELTLFVVGFLGITGGMAKTSHTVDIVIESLSKPKK